MRIRRPRRHVERADFEAAVAELLERDAARAALGVADYLAAQVRAQAAGRDDAPSSSPGAS